MKEETLIYAGIGLAAVAVIYYVGSKAVDAAAGIASGNNSLTQNQTDLSGEKTTAYEGKGVIGTLGAGFNTLSGGTLASLGETLGSWAFDAFGPKVYLNPDAKGPQ